MKTCLLTYVLCAVTFLVTLCATRGADPSFVPTYSLNWPDRRIIGFNIIGQNAFSSATNPRGWLNQPTSNYVSAEGIADWRLKMLAIATNEIAILTNMNAQGVIFWDLEGDETSFSYAGDPTQLSIMAPEMDACIDEVMAKYTAAGLKVGCTIRRTYFQSGTTLPGTSTVGQKFYKADAAFGSREYRCLTNNTWTQMAAGGQESVTDFYTNFLSKIAYAVTRWNAKLFYIDSWSTPITDYKVIAASNTMAIYPDILLMPEGGFVAAQMTNMFAMTAPFLQPSPVGYGTPPNVIGVYPSAFGVLQVQDPYTNFFGIVGAIRTGNIMLVNSRYANAGMIMVTNAYGRLWTAPSSVLKSVSVGGTGKF